MIIQGSYTWRGGSNCQQLDRFFFEQKANW